MPIVLGHEIAGYGRTYEKALDLKVRASIKNERNYVFAEKSSVKRRENIIMCNL